MARRNAARHDAEVTFILSDLLAALPRGEARYDLIVSNPPYIASAELDGLMPEVSRYEPRHALDGGADGLDVIRRLLAEAIAQLRPDGALLVEIGSEQGAAVAALFEQHGLAAEVKRDLAGHDRVVRGTRRKA